MEKKLRLLSYFGIIQLIILIILLNYQHGITNILGKHFIKLGNRTIIVNPPEGSIIIDKEDKIKEKLNTKEELAFIIVGDSLNSQRPILMVDYLQMGQYENIDDLFNFLKNDSTVFFVAKEINENDLLIKQFAPLQDTTAYILSKYIKCYPYYLRERIVWMGEGKTPEIVSETIEAIEVKK